MLGPDISVSPASRFFVEPATRVCPRQILPSAFSGLAERKVTFDLSRLPTRLHLHSSAETGVDGLLVQIITRFYQTY